MEFVTLLKELGEAVSAADGRRIAAVFTPDGVFHDTVYGPATGREEIRKLFDDRVAREGRDYRLELYDAVRDGILAYACYRFSFTSTLDAFAGTRVAISGMVRLVLEDGRIKDYREAANQGVALAQLGLAPERMAKIFARWADEQNRDPVMQAHLATG
jgi:ketosteroid isomerase-like protein